MSEAYERIDESPKFDGKERNLHESRYRIAAGYCVPNNFVLDAGCGTGYALEFLNRDLYLGIDKNPIDDPSKFAKVDFEDPGQSYDWLPIFDTFVGLECIEHLNDDGVKAFVRLAWCATKWIVVSTPIVPNSNPYHKQQFTEKQIIDLFEMSEKWKLYDVLKQDNERYGIFIFKRQ